MLGDLSKNYESSGDPGAIGYDALGGYSYGLYQFATNAGVPQAFVSWLQGLGAPYDQYGNVLAAYNPGSREFNAEWTDLATTDPGGFGQLQHDYTKSVYYDAAVAALAGIGFDVENHSETLKQVLWSRSVQYSAGNMVELFQTAAQIAGQDLNAMSDHDLIYNIYEVCLYTPGWRCGSDDVKEALANRFNAERDDALAMLEG